MLASVELRRHTWLVHVCIGYAAKARLVGYGFGYYRCLDDVQVYLREWTRSMHSFISICRYYGSIFRRSYLILLHIHFALIQLIIMIINNTIHFIMPIILIALPKLQTGSRDFYINFWLNCYLLDWCLCASNNNCFYLSCYSTLLNCSHYNNMMAKTSSCDH